MTPQEKDLTTILLDRLNKTGGQKDPDAEALIRQATAERHGAPYYLVRTVLIQDLCLHNAQRRITDLEMQLTETKLNSSGAPSFLGGPSFLGAVFDRSSPSRDVRQNNVPPGGLATGPPPFAAKTTPPPEPVIRRHCPASERPF